MYKVVPMAFMLKVPATASSNFNKRVQQGRERLEKPRPVSKKRLQEEMSKIVKDEVQFTKSVLKHIIPVDISIDKKATGLKKLIPLNIEMINDDVVPSSNINEVYVNETSDAILVDDNDAML